MAKLDEKEAKHREAMARIDEARQAINQAMGYVDRANIDQKIYQGIDDLFKEEEESDSQNEVFHLTYGVREYNHHRLDGYTLDYSSQDIHIGKTSETFV